MAVVPFGPIVPKDGVPPDWGLGHWERRRGSVPPWLRLKRSWNWSKVTPYEVELRCRYPSDDDIEELIRRITPVPDRAAVDIETRGEGETKDPFARGPAFHVRQARTRAIFDRVHFATRGRTPAHRTRKFRHSRQIADFRISVARRQVTADTSTPPSSRCPYPRRILIQLNEVDGHFAIDFPGDDSRVSLSWNRKHFPSLLLWMSNRGLLRPPWNGEHVALVRSRSAQHSAWDRTPLATRIRSPKAASTPSSNSIPPLPLVRLIGFRQRHSPLRRSSKGPRNLPNGPTAIDD